MSIDSLLSLFVQYGYWIVFGAILLDNAGMPIPGELLLLMFGVVARHGDLNLGIGFLVASAAAMSGDSVGYWLGRLTGDRVLRTYCRVTLGSGTCVEKAVGYYEHYGKATVIVGRFVMGIRAFLSPLAGSARMPFHQFLLFDSLGAVLWSSLFLLIGYSFGWRLESVHEGYQRASIALLSAVGVSFGVYLVVKLLRRRDVPALFGEPIVARLICAFRRLRRPIFAPSPSMRSETEVMSDDAGSAISEPRTLGKSCQTTQRQALVAERE